MTTRHLVFSVLFASMWAGEGVPQKSSKGMAMNPDFSAAATELVRSIDSYEGVTEVGIPEISDALAAASTRAHSQGDQQAMTALRTFLEDKLDNNALRSETLAKAEAAWKKKHAGSGPTANETAAVKLETMDLPGVREMTHREDDCAAELRQIFGMKSYRVPARCADVRLRHDEHAMLQYFRQTAGS